MSEANYRRWLRPDGDVTHPRYIPEYNDRADGWMLRDTTTGELVPGRRYGTELGAKIAAGRLNRAAILREIEALNLAARADGGEAVSATSESYCPACNVYYLDHGPWCEAAPQADYRAARGILPVPPGTEPPERDARGHRIITTLRRLVAEAEGFDATCIEDPDVIPGWCVVHRFKLPCPIGGIQEWIEGEGE